MSDEVLVHVLSIGTWLPPDGATPVSGSTQLAKAEDTKPATSTAEHINNNLQIPSNLLSYYSHISKIILGNSENLIKVSMSTLGQSQDFFTSWTAFQCIHTLHHPRSPYRKIDITLIKGTQHFFFIKIYHKDANKSLHKTREPPTEICHTSLYAWCNLYSNFS